MAWQGIIFYLHGQARARKLSCLEPFYSYHIKPEEIRKEFGMSWNLASQATTLTIRSWLLRAPYLMMESDLLVFKGCESGCPSKLLKVEI